MPPPSKRNGPAERFLARRPVPTHRDSPVLRAQCEARVASPRATGKEITLWQLSKEVRRLLHASGDPSANWATDMYWALYGPESYTTLAWWARFDQAVHARKWRHGAANQRGALDPSRE